MPVSTIAFSNDFALLPTRRHPVYHLGMVYICVQDTEFYLPRHHFENESAWFRGRFAQLYADAGAIPEPLALARPDSFMKATPKIWITDTDPADFEHLVHILYPNEWGDNFLDIDPRGWAAVLKLAHRWGFARIKALAIARIDALPKKGIISGFQLLSLYRKYDVQHWFPTSLRLLCEQDLAKEDKLFRDMFMEEIGEDYTLRIFNLQGQVRTLHRIKKDKKEKVLESDIETCIRDAFPELNSDE